jgi:hypothetical protein
MNKQMLHSHHKQINAIHQLLRQMLHQTEQLQQAQRPLHRLDRDLLIRQTQELYEWLFIMADEDEQKAVPVQQPLPTEANQKNFEPKVLVKKEDPAPEPIKPQHEEPEPLVHQEEKTAPLKPEVTFVATPEEKPQPDLIESETPDPKTVAEEEKPQTPQRTVVEAAQPKPTPLELFSQETPPSVADHLQNKEDSSIGAKMERQPIQDLRAAIGINDKFLLINELFSGSLEAYNKMLDELNEFKSFNGASTYLIELKVEKQWDSKLPSWKKLVQLLERKFNVKPEDHAL